MHVAAHTSAVATIRSPSASGSVPARSRAISITTWCSDASTSPPNSCRSSETIVNDSTSARSAWARSSISAGVACRPAKTPKFTRTSSAGRSCEWTRKAIRGSTSILMPSWYRRNRNLTLARLPAELPDGYGERAGAPGREHPERRRPRPDQLPAQVDRVDDVDEVLERQDVADHAQEVRIVPGRPERARDERHRQEDEVHDRGRALAGADERRGRDADRREGRRAEDDS